VPLKPLQDHRPYRPAPARSLVHPSRLGNTRTP
jgi:hypothetical protein